MPRAPRPSPQQTTLALVTGFWVSQLVYVAAELGIADVLATGPKTVEAIAKKVGAHAPSLRRVLRALASVGLFAETATGRFRLTPTGATLRSNVPGSVRDFARAASDDYAWQAWGALLHGVTTGEQPFEHLFGKPIFPWLQEHPAKEQVFAGAMAGISAEQNPAVAAAYDFGRLHELVDVGGAHGHLLGAILRRHRRLRGVLYDQPQMIAGVEASGFLRGLRARCRVVGGDFLTAVPAGADGYLLKYILHDWDDDVCVRILTNCRAAMAPGGRVLVVENVITAGNRPHFGKLLDVNMLVLTPGGRERTRAEFGTLFARAGLRLRRTVPTSMAMGILEATRA